MGEAPDGRTGAPAGGLAGGGADGWAGGPRPPVAILCGGRGARLREHTEEIPKPLVEIGGMPILWHVIRCYAVYGFSRFLLATGYRGEQIEDFAATTRWPQGLDVRCIDTGLETNTGGRLQRLAPALAGEQRFCATYADGLADLDLRALLTEHVGHAAGGALATMTVVRPQLQFGVTELAADGRVCGFREKPRSEHWINGGFFCFEAAVLDRLTPDSVLEREPLAGLAGDGLLRAHPHTGFWECMDTYKDAVALNDLWQAGRAPWARWLPGDEGVGRRSVPGDEGVGRRSVPGDEGVGRRSVPGDEGVGRRSVPASERLGAAHPEERNGLPHAAQPPLPGEGPAVGVGG